MSTFESRMEKVTQQRDELLAALKRKLESELKSRSLGLTRDEVFIEYAEAAIAKVESEK